MVEVKLSLGAKEAVLEIEKETKLLEILQKNNFEIDADCGGAGRCGNCKVVVQGELSPLKSKERDLLSELELEQGVRLACLTEVEGAVEIEHLLGNRTSLQILDEGTEGELALKPQVQKQYLELIEPSLADQVSDWTRVLRELKQKPEIELELLKQLPTILREADYQLTVVQLAGQVIALEAGDTTADIYGLAFDIGTTTVVGYLLDLSTGAQLGKAALNNQQMSYGADAISRVNYTLAEEKGAIKLQEKIIETINRIISQLLSEHQVNKERVYELTFVGNTIMNHLLLGLETEYIAKSPYVSVINEAQLIPAHKLGIELGSSSYLSYLPNVASYVGSDIVAGVLISEMAESSELKLLIDLGTNSEIVLGNQERIIACAAAAGPAFEGAEIEFGMRGTEGAIEKLRITEAGVKIEVIGQQAPKGICGSGIVDLLAELLKNGLIDKTGRLLAAQDLDDDVAESIKELIIEEDKSRKLILVEAEQSASGEAITVSQKDIRAIQLAQGAIRAGIKILMKELGVEIADIKEVLIAGGFGNYIDHQQAVEFGLLPAADEIEYRGIGNAAGSGAKAAVLTTDKRKAAEKIAQKIEYFELSGRADFQTEFTEAMTFKKFE
ncbi:ASKHA domain-containing protein [Fuchsiella alkaliacetigena]|uniref:ASKHA domain-containing protein n=1 Tax=Fuchsiella alkaliacetigena TaxID=957042 RepID=UPI00200A9142|nr:ASKHA domain-containing protein [Fuchsiella alkaliacetigena]MCK8823985.1 ASKHA domain-containing protein [Fuchsiella alkaliacetigena]